MHQPRKTSSGFFAKARILTEKDRQALDDAVLRGELFCTGPSELSEKFMATKHVQFDNKALLKEFYERHQNKF